MMLTKPDAYYAAKRFIEYFDDFGRIDDYFRARKIERVRNIPSPLPGMSMEDDLFQNFDIHPQDMNFKIATIPNEQFDTLLEKTASFSPDESPGKTHKMVVFETFLTWTYSTNVLLWVSILYHHNLLVSITWVVN